MKSSGGFFSDSEYLFLPTKLNPKVALAIDNEEIAKNSFKLYNPFSLKAKILKYLANSSYSLLKRFGFIEKKEKTSFVRHLESIFRENFIVSVYFSTDRNKAVLQLQKKKAEILGYVKIALNETGNQRLINEEKGITLFQSKQIETAKIVYSGNYMNFRFIVMEELKGKSQNLSEKEIWKVLNVLKKKKYSPLDHPRILSLISFFNDYGLLEFSSLLEKVSRRIRAPLYESYEHGDFAPWNVMKFNGRIILFDLEYFEEKGLEYMDLIKYYFQVFHLLKKKRGKHLLEAVEKKIGTTFSKELLIIFLLKEITIKIQENKKYKFEEELLNLLEAEL